MVTAGYVVLLGVLVTGAGWGLWHLLAEFTRNGRLTEVGRRRSQWRGGGPHPATG